MERLTMLPQTLSSVLVVPIIFESWLRQLIPENSVYGPYMCMYNICISVLNIVDDRPTFFAVAHILPFAAWNEYFLSS